MTRRAAMFVLVLSLLSLAAPLIAPYEAGLGFRDFLHAPPMRPHFQGAAVPVVHPVVLADRLEQRFEADLTRRTGRPTAVVTSVTRPVPLIHEFRLTPMHETLEELLARGADGLISMTIEGKVRESFDKTLGEWAAQASEFAPTCYTAVAER